MREFKYVLKLILKLKSNSQLYIIYPNIERFETICMILLDLTPPDMTTQRSYSLTVWVYESYQSHNLPFHVYDPSYDLQSSKIKIVFSSSYLWAVMIYLIALMRTFIWSSVTRMKRSHLQLRFRRSGALCTFCAASPRGDIQNPPSSVQ